MRVTMSGQYRRPCRLPVFTHEMQSPWSRLRCTLCHENSLSLLVHHHLGEINGMFSVLGSLGKVTPQGDLSPQSIRENSSSGDSDGPFPPESAPATTSWDRCWHYIHSTQNPFSL